MIEDLITEQERLLVRILTEVEAQRVPYTSATDTLLAKILIELRDVSSTLRDVREQLS